MLPKEYMTENEKLRAVGMLDAGQSQNSISRHFGKSKSVIAQLVSQYRQTGGVNIRNGRGRPKKRQLGRVGLCVRKPIQFGARIEGYGNLTFKVNES